MADDKDNKHDKHDKDLLSRADSLINAETGAAHSDRRESLRRLPRRRSFVASTTVTATPAVHLSPPSSDDDDLPLLTDVVIPAPTGPEEDVDHMASRLRSTLAADLADLVDRRLSSELPALLDAALVKAADHLRHGIAATIDTALRDFVAERGQLRLPLAEPDSGQAATARQQPAAHPEPPRDPV